MSEINVARVRDALQKLKGLRAQKEKLEQQIRDVSAEAIPLMGAVDPAGKGVVFEFGDERVAGWVRQNAASDDVDQVGLIEALTRAGKFDSVSTRVLDMRKLEAEIAAGNIRAQFVKRFMTPGKRPSPYVAFAKPKKDSI